MSGLTEITEASMVAAHQAGMAYWNRNKPYDATPENVKMLARTLGYRGITPLIKTNSRTREIVVPCPAAFLVSIIVGFGGSGRMTEVKWSQERIFGGPFSEIVVCFQ